MLARTSQVKAPEMARARAALEPVLLTHDLLSNPNAPCVPADSIERSASNVLEARLIMAQAGPITDITQRLFLDLKSRNEETRVRAAFELYDNVLSVSRGTMAL